MLEIGEDVVSASLSPRLRLPVDDCLLDIVFIGVAIALLDGFAGVFGVHDVSVAVCARVRKAGDILHYCWR